MNLLALRAEENGQEETFFSWLTSFLPETAAMLAKYWMTLLVLTVFPAPDSPLQMNQMLSVSCKGKYNHCESFDLRDEDGLILSVCKTEANDLVGNVSREMFKTVVGGGFPTCQHVLVRVVGDGVDVRRSFTPLLPSVGVDHGLVVNRQPLVGVDGDAEEPRVRLRSQSHRSVWVRWTPRGH